MALGSKDLTSEQLRSLEDERLVEALREAKKELFNLRFRSATGQLEHNHQLRSCRKDIARIYTEMRERELGISSAPAPVEEKKAKKSAKADKKADKTESAEKVG